MFKMINLQKTRTKVVHKKVSQGYNKLWSDFKETRYNLNSKICKKSRNLFIRFKKLPLRLNLKL